MNVFSYRNQIIEDYIGYVSSFISIAQPRLRNFVNQCFASGSLWPDPLIQLNPTFKPGKTVDELVKAGVLETGCSQVFRRDKTATVGSGEDLLFHQHQEDAIRKAKEGRNYVLTTGTGSGKSLSYIVPIVGVGIGGWSYGGFMTMWAVTQTNRFRASVAGAGIANWQSYYGQNEIPQWVIPYFGASVYDDPAVYARSSPINFIKSVRTPALILVGERDGGCPPPQSFEFWRALQELKIESQLVVYPNEGHNIAGLENRRDIMRRVTEWFDRHLK